MNEQIQLDKNFPVDFNVIESKLLPFLKDLNHEGMEDCRNRFSEKNISERIYRTAFDKLELIKKRYKLDFDTEDILLASINNSDIEIIQLLKDPDILQRFNKEFDKLIVGEDNIRKAVFLFALGKFVLNANPTSYNLLVTDDTGMGKDHIVSSVLSMFEKGLEKDYLQLEKVTPEALEPLSKLAKDWTGKIIYYADIKQNLCNSETFKTFSSGADMHAVYRDGKVDLIKIKGKPVQIATTMNATLTKELSRRFLSISLVDKKDQTKEIMKRWADFKEKGIVPVYDIKYTKALKALKLIKVKIPYASMLVEHFPHENKIMRTQWTRFLDLISCSVVLHQFQREMDKEGYFLANWKDYDISLEILKIMLEQPGQIPLTFTDKKILSALTDIKMSISVLENKTHLTPKTLRNRLMQLADFGLIAVDLDRESNYKPTQVFTKLIVNKFKFKNSSEILSNVTKETNITNFTNITNVTNNTNILINEPKVVMAR